MSEKACDGGRTLDADHDMLECVECGRRIRWDLVDHPFWGFQNCEDRTSDPPVERSPASTSGAPR